MKKYRRSDNLSVIGREWLMNEWFLYMIRCADGSIYTGITTDVERRFKEHSTGRGSRYLKGRGPLRIVYRETVGTRSEALKLEARIKKMKKTEKESLITNGNLTFFKLY